MIKLDGKVALVTGSSSGIGAAVAVQLAKLGAQVVVTGRDAEKLEKVAQECTAANPAHPPFVIQADLSKEKDVVDLAAKTLDKFNKLDILVNNVGVLKWGTLENTTLEDLDWMMNTNLRSVFQLTKLCVPSLEKTQGCIVNVSSLAGLRSLEGALAYGMTKAALDQFTRIIALELAPKKVRVNSVNPGAIRTGIFRGLDEDLVNALWESQATKHPMGRIGDVEEAASVVVFLVSDMASFVTGVTLAVDGGRYVSYATSLKYDDSSF